MGGIIKAECKCGFKTDFMGGSGKHNFEEVCNAPALCRNCRELIVGNYMDVNLTCEKCNGEITFYNDPQLQEGSEAGESGKRETIFILPSEKCLCPKCDEKELRFIHMGCWG